MDRPARLDAPRVCGECIYITSYNDKFNGSCSEIFGVKSGTKACVKFRFAIQPKRYRADAEIAALNGIATSRYAHVDDLHREVQTLAMDGVFAALRKRKKLYVLETDAADLLEKIGDTEGGLKPLFERTQRLRDRAVIIIAQARDLKSDLDTLWSRGESLLRRRYEEVAKIKPAADRAAFVQEVFTEIDVRQLRLNDVVELCETVMRNCQSAHSALIEIQAAHRANPAPFRRTPDSETGRGGRTSYIRRRG